MKNNFSVEQFPKSVTRFSDKNCVKNKELERFTELGEVKSALDEAREVAIEALGYIAAHPELLQRFLALSGIAAADIRQAAMQQGFWAAILQFLCANEPDLLAFCHSATIAPEQINAALEVLPGGFQTGNEETL